jgi:hypothetical protein
LTDSAVAEADSGTVDIALLVNLLELQPGVRGVALEQQVRSPGVQSNLLR